MAKITILSEEEAERGWAFVVAATNAEAPRLFRLRVAWADHDRWTGGVVAPSRLAEAVARLLADNDELPEENATIDAAEVARRFPDFRAMVEKRL